MRPSDVSRGLTEPVVLNLGTGLAIDVAEKQHFRQSMCNPLWATYVKSRSW